MSKLLLLIAIIVVAALLVRRALKFGSARKDSAAAAPGPTAVPPDAKLVRCVACGAFVPKSDALPVPDGFRCGGAGCKGAQ
jgi:hypothetical protein